MWKQEPNYHARDHGRVPINYANMRQSLRMIEVRRVSPTSLNRRSMAWMTRVITDNRVLYTWKNSSEDLARQRVRRILGHGKTMAINWLGRTVRLTGESS